MHKRLIPQRTFDPTTSTLRCDNNHVYTTAMRATFTGTPCPTCGKPLRSDR